MKYNTKLNKTKICMFILMYIITYIIVYIHIYTHIIIICITRMYIYMYAGKDGRKICIYLCMVIKTDVYVCIKYVCMCMYESMSVFCM